MAPAVTRPQRNPETNPAHQLSSSSPPRGRGGDCSAGSCRTPQASAVEGAIGLRARATRAAAAASGADLVTGLLPFGGALPGLFARKYLILLVPQEGFEPRPTHYEGITSRKNDNDTCNLEFLVAPLSPDMPWREQIWPFANASGIG